MLTLNLAKQHLAGLRKLAVSENQYLKCVHTYLRDVEVDILDQIRGDQFATHAEVAAVIDDILVTRRQIDAYLRGAL